MRIVKYISGVILIMGLWFVACEKSPVNYIETLPVKTTLNILTINLNGHPISVPVTIKILETSSPAYSEILPEHITRKTDGEGVLSITNNFSLDRDSRVEIIVDVETPNLRSIQYWTAYITANDAPGKQFNLKLDIASK